MYGAHVEGIFAKSRHIALRMPSKSAKLAAVERALHTTDINKRHDARRTTEAERVYLAIPTR